MEIKDISVLETKSVSSFVSSQLGSGYGSVLTPSYAYYLWEKVDSIGQACDMISMAFQQIRPALKDKQTNEYLTDPKAHPFLRLLENPGFRQTSMVFKYELMTSFLVAGECFPVLVGNVNFDPVGIYSVKANKSDLLEDSGGELYSINLTASNRIKSYSRESIIKRNMWIYQSKDKLEETVQIYIKRRRSGIRGLSKIERIYLQALTKYYGNVHNTGLLKNGSRPSGMFSPDKESLSQDQYEAFKTDVRENFTGPANAGQTVISPQPVKYTNLMLMPRDMDFIKLIESDKIDIYNQYDIPLPLVLTGTMTMNNYSTSIEAFYDMAVLPRARFLYKYLEKFILPRYKDGDRYEIEIDERQISALKDRMFERGKKMRAIYSFSENEIRNESGYESTDEGDLIYKPANLLPSGEDDDFVGDQIIKINNEDEE